jgi:uncharacterized protein
MASHISRQDGERARGARPGPGLCACLSLLVLLLLLAPPGAWAKVWPRPEGPVADYAKVIDAAQAQRITQVATELWQKTQVAVVVATLPSLDGRPLEETAVDLYRAWGIGDKNANKGALILVAVGERRVRIEVGYGLEGALTDLQSGRIRDQVLVPKLKEGDYGQALYLGVAAIAQVAAAETGATLTDVPAVKFHAEFRGGGGVGLSVSVFLVIMFIYLGLKGRRSVRDGGNFWTGVILGLLMSGGRGSSGGGGGDFDSFGGGFGGFGGGSSGGGGASGDF